MSTISVIIPAYNRAGLIGATLESLINQTIPAKEIIVVDDGSTDATASIAESFGPLITVLRQENRGPAAARNLGFHSSSGEFIHFFDSDDIASPNKHEVQLKALLDENADIAYSPWEKGDISNGLFTSTGVVLQSNGLPGKDLIKALLTHWSIVPIACLFRRKLVEGLEGFPEGQSVAEDQLLFLRCLLAGVKVVHTPETLALYRNNNEGKITDPSADMRHHIVEWAKFLVVARSECLSKGMDPAEWFGFRRRVWQALEDFKAFDIHEEGLASQLEGALDKKRGPLSYALARALVNKFQGVKKRTLGYREHAYFRARRVSKEPRPI